MLNKAKKHALAFILTIGVITAFFIIPIVISIIIFILIMAAIYMIIRALINDTEDDCN